MHSNLLLRLHRFSVDMLFQEICFDCDMWIVNGWASTTYIIYYHCRRVLFSFRACMRNETNDWYPWKWLVIESLNSLWLDNKAMLMRWVMIEGSIVHRFIYHSNETGWNVKHEKLFDSMHIIFIWSECGDKVDILSLSTNGRWSTLYNTF